MFIAIATDDFPTFTDTNQTEYPIFTGMSVEETRNRVENYFCNCYDAGDDIPEYEICEIVTKAIVKGAYKLVTECSHVNS